MKTIRERRDQLASQIMKQADALPRVDCTIQSLALMGDAAILVSDDAEGDHLLLEYEAGGGLIEIDEHIEPTADKGPQDDAEPPSEYVRLMKILADEERDRRLSLAQVLSTEARKPS